MTIFIGAFALALLATLALAAFLTPARWWRRPNVKALAVLLIGTWGIGSALLALAPDRAEARVADIAPLVRTPDTADTAAYLVFEDLNLRAAAGVHARRLALVPAGSTVTTTGVREGDWWQVRAQVNQLPVDGWVSSLWLRRAEEAQGRRAYKMH
jgi:hypothetical protein